MSLPLRKRTVHFYEIRLQSSTRAAIKSPSCASLPDLLESFARLAIERNLPHSIRKTSQIHTVLSDWSYDKVSNSYSLLISKANAALSDVALRDLKTAKLRKAGKTKIEGIEVSAHVLVRPNSDGKTAAVLLTMGAGVSAKDVEILLGLFSREAAKIIKNNALFYFDEPSGAKDADGKPLQYKVRYSFPIYAHQGQTLKDALYSGEFQEMVLISNVRSKFDSGGNLQVTEHSLKVQADLPKSVTAASISNAVRFFKKSSDGAGYDKLRIHYKTVSNHA